MGRPRKYNSPEEMQKAIEAYFKEIKLETRPPSVCGLALYLGFASRVSFFDYDDYSDEFSFIIKKAKTKIEQYHEEQLGVKNCAGHIFWLKANAQWQEPIKQEIVHSFDWRSLTKDGSGS